MEVKWKDWQATEQLCWVVPGSTTAEPKQLQQRWQRVGVHQPETQPPHFAIEYEWRPVPTIVAGSVSTVKCL